MGFDQDKAGKIGVNLDACIEVCEENDESYQRGHLSDQAQDDICHIRPNMDDMPLAPDAHLDRNGGLSKAWI
jgi:hypothetical protein